MTIEPEDHVAEIVAAAGGKLVSRIRLQKIAYLLDQIGSETDFDYVYYHYGPFSRDLENAILDAEAFGLVKEEEGRRASDGARYSIFTSGRTVEEFKVLKDSRLRDWTRRLASENVTVLELAATAHWLVTYEHIQDWQTEIRRRKGTKNDGGRLEKAKELLRELHLEPVGAAS
ncbi:uncharacterized protein YwgA [Sinorhizobium meliloti]